MVSGRGSSLPPAQLSNLPVVTALSILLIPLLLFPVHGVAAEGLSLFILSEKNLYRAGDSIHVTLHVINQGPRPAVLHFRTAQRYDLIAEDAHGRQVWRWAKGRMFAQVLGKEVIAPSGRLSYHVAIDQPLPSGQYKITGLIPADNGPLSNELTIQVQ